MSISTTPRIYKHPAQPSHVISGVTIWRISEQVITRRAYVKMLLGVVAPQNASEVEERRKSFHMVKR